MNGTVFEITESLNAALSFPGGTAPPRISIAQETTQITILDDDCEWIYETFHAHLYLSALIAMIYNPIGLYKTMDFTYINYVHVQTRRIELSSH